MSDRISIGEMADAVMKELDEYKNLAKDRVKKAVKDAGSTVRSDISANAPVRKKPWGGRYKKSWVSRTTGESSTSIEVTVYSPTRYMLAHLLEHGHAKRGGGRVEGKPHIAPAEQKGIQQLEEDIQKALEG